MESEKAFETKLNVYLSNILSEKLGVHNIIAETRVRSGRPDILVTIGGVKIVIEGSYSKKDAEEDINKKVEGGFADIGIALWYKEKIPDTTEKEIMERIQQSKFNVKLFLPKDISNTLISYLEVKKLKSIPISDWSEADIFVLTDLITNAYEFLIKEEFVAQMLEEIKTTSADFVIRLKSFDKTDKISENLYNIFYRLNGLHVGDYKQIAELIYAQTFLNLLLSISFYELIQSNLGFKSLNYLVSQSGEKEGLRKAFKLILGKDYTQIYEVSLEIIENIPSNLLKSVIELGIKLSSKQTFLKRDFSGRIYHQIVGSWSVQKGFATYYTTIPAAYMISYLSIFSEFKPFKNPENIKVCDFTCGSGTLLSAAYSSLEDLYKIEKFEEGEIDLDNFYENAIEKNFWGFDALRYALQIASLNLVFHNPSTAIDNMNFWATPIGVDKNGRTLLGSLIYLKKETLTKFFVDYKAKKTTAVDTENNSISIPNFDLILMNPPFTRATGRGGKEGGGLFGFIVDKEVRDSVLNEYKNIREHVKESLLKIGKKYLNKLEEGTFGGIGQAGEGLLFVYLAYKHLNDGGRIAFVLPKSVLSGSSWFLIRSLLLERFHLEYVVVSYDKDNGYNFSESTDLSETLIVARKTEDADNQSTKFIMLLNKPQTSFEAKALAKSIIKNGNYAEAGSSSAYVYSIPKKELKENIDNWGRFVAFPNIRLLKFIEELNNGKLFEKNINIIKLNEIASLGIDRHQFNDMFKITDKKTPGSYPVVHGGEEEQRTYMLGEFNAFAVPKDEKAEEVFKEKSSYLLISSRMRFNTSHIISNFLPSKTLSNMFYAIKLNEKESEDKYKALCCWLNSTFGLLLILANRQETEGAWIELSLSHWRLQGVLDITKLDKKTIEKLSNIIDKYGTMEMSRLPEQYNTTNIKSQRLAFDKEVLEALNIKVDDEKLKELYRIIYESFEQWFEI